MSTSPADEAAQIRQLLRQSLETVIAKHYPFEKRYEAHRSEQRESYAAWSAYSDLGLLSIGLPEAHGGLPGDLDDVAMAAEMMGGALTLEPYRPAMIGARLLAAAGTTAQQREWLPALATGARKIMLAHAETSVADHGRPAATATRAGSGWRITGGKSVVAGGDAADLFIVSAQAEGEVGLFLVPADAVERQAYRCFDWTGGADLTFADTFVPMEARLAGGEAALLLALDEETALACADAVGAIRAANALTRDYARTRRQFGVAIASFQVLQHRMVDMTIAEELAAAITAQALMACLQPDAAARARAVSAAKVRTGDSARLVAQQCVQIHGGMGLTEEYPASHYFARLGLFERLCGDRDAHLQRFIAAG